ncbi:MAG: DNA mismatch endonuclease Vsr [bacterium]|nr:DNA mismatch endonuclease Vsr [bacterium]
MKLIGIFKKNKIIGWRRKSKLTGKPDFVFSKKKIVIFTDGCFWHGHGCRGKLPQNNSKYWLSKIKRNIERDKIVSVELRKKGWKVIRLWECKIIQTKLPNKLKVLK